MSTQPVSPAIVGIARKVALASELDESDVRTMAMLAGRYESAADFLRVVAAGLEASARLAIADGVEGEAEELLWETVEAVKQSALNADLAAIDERMGAVL